MSKVQGWRVGGGGRVHTVVLCSTDNKLQLYRTGECRLIAVVACVRFVWRFGARIVHLYVRWFVLWFIGVRNLNIIVKQVRGGRAALPRVHGAFHCLGLDNTWTSKESARKRLWWLDRVDGRYKLHTQVDTFKSTQERVHYFSWIFMTVTN